MSKELDPSLFGEGAWASPRTVEKPKSNFDAVGHIEQKVVDLRLQHRELKEDFAKMGSDLEEFKRSTGHRLDKLTQQVARLEGIQGKLHQEVTLRVSQLHTRLGERQTMDLKIQEMIERHQAMIRSSEIRLQQLQKILAEKEAQLLSAQISLNEARTEIARMKRL